MRVISTLLPAVLCSAAWGQTPVSARSFDIASIHPTEPGERTELIGTDPGSFNMHNVTLRRCIEWAYELNPNQLVGPDWLSDVRYDIAARAEDRTANDDQLHLMLQSLLSSRFGLKFHREQKEQSVYTLTLAKGGLKLHAQGTKDASKMVESTTEGPNKFSEDKTGAMADRVTMADLARKLSELLGRVVTDKTGLTKRYDFRLDITPYLLANDGGDGPKPDVMSVLFTGFQEQLGLKLEAGRGMVNLLILDSGNKSPTEN